MIPSAEATLRRGRMVTLLALAALTLLAWAWLLQGAGMEMAPRATLDLFPHRGAGGTAGMPDVRGMPGMAMANAGSWTAASFALAASMWWVMMVAMMLPAATPVVLLYAATAPRSGAERSPTGHFLAGYLAVWALFSLIAAGLQWLLDASKLLEPMTLGSAAKWFSAAVLVAAGFYQLSPLKEACLAHCRNPAQFLSRHYRPGRAGAFRMGARHGAFCVGCCWLLMALLFVGGVMNLAWIALLTLLVAAEKLLPAGRGVAIAAGLGLIAWGGATAFA